MKLSAEEFNRLFSKSGYKTNAKGRPVIDISLFADAGDVNMNINRRVLNASKVKDAEGNVLADSKWEYRCKGEMDDAGLRYDFQRSFELLPTLRAENFGTLRRRKWSPDFTFEELKIVADAKGYVTEIAKIKIHMFLHIYEGWKVFLLKNKSDLFTFINYIKQIQDE